MLTLLANLKFPKLYCMKSLPVSLFLFTFFSISASYAQNELKISTSNNSRLIEILNNAKLISENSEEWLSVRVYQVDNGSGSAGFPSGEVSHNLLIAVSEFGEEPNQCLFEIGPFYTPEFIQWIGEKEYEKTFEIEYGNFDARKILKLNVTIDRLTIEK